MTRKDYVAIAEELAREESFHLPSDGTSRTAVAMVALRLANRFAAEDPSFDAGRFLLAAIRDEDSHALIRRLGGPMVKKVNS